MHETATPGSDLCNLLERCIVCRDDAAWRSFLLRFESLVRAVLAAARSTLRPEEFLDWFPGHLYEHRKVQALYLALLGKIEGGECPTAAQQETFVRNYLALVIRSALGDWYRQHRDFPQAGQDLKDHPGPQAPVAREDGMEEVRSALLQLDAELRIPFWLRHYRALGPLTDDDANLVAGQTGSTAEEVARRIEQEASRHPDHQMPLSSRFIGTLLGLPPLSNGKYAAVDQRVRRAYDRLRSMLGPAREEEP
jgi:hypothetical protein